MMNLNSSKILEGIDLSSLDFSFLGKIPEEEAKKNEQWLLDRRGKFTASEAHKLTTFQDDKKFMGSLPPGGVTYAEEVGIECITVPDLAPRFKSKSMEFGSENEGQAAIEFSRSAGLEVCHFAPEQIFVKKGEHFGCTPDGLIYSEDNPDKIIAGLETKCPNTRTHLKYLKFIRDAKSLKEICPDYYWQIMFSMFVTGATHWYFASYDPRMLNEYRKLHWIRIERDDTEIHFLRMRLAFGIQIKQQIIAENA